MKVHQRRELRPYQEWCADKFVRERILFLTLDMAMGKTIIAGTAIRDLFRLNRIRHVLIVAPLRVAESVWKQELAQWTHTSHLTVEIATGLPGQRRRAINKRAQITVINRENLPWLYKMLEARARDWPWDCVIWDESSALKEWKKRTSGTKLNPHVHNMTRFGAMATVRKSVRYMMLLTGTPAPHGIKDLGGQAFILDQGGRLGEKKEHFLSRWFRQDPYTYEYEALPGARAQIMEKLSDVMVALKAEDYVDLPKVVFNDIKVDLPRHIMDEYRQFERDSVSEKYKVEAVTAGILTNKLLQFANGAMYRGGEDLEVKAPRTIVPVHTAKLDAMSSVIEEAAGQNVMVGYSFKFDLERIRKRYPKAVVLGEDKNAWKKWNDGSIRMLLTHPASAGHGLNLQFGGHILCWYGLNWSLELYLQLNKRLPRPGQSWPFVTVHRIIARGTMDETLVDVLDQREADQNSVVDAVRVRLEGLHGHGTVRRRNALSKDALALIG